MLKAPIYGKVERNPAPQFPLPVYQIDDVFVVPDLGPWGKEEKLKEVKEIFVYGKGYCKVSKSKIAGYAGPLPPGWDSSHLIPIWQKYGILVIHKLIGLDFQHCTGSMKNHELHNILFFGEQYDDLIRAFMEIDEAGIAFRKERWKVEQTARKHGPDILRYKGIQDDGGFMDHYSFNLRLATHVEHEWCVDSPNGGRFGVAHAAPMFCPFTLERSLDKFIRGIAKFELIPGVTTELLKYTPPEQWERVDAELTAGLQSMSVQDKCELVYGPGSGDKIKELMGETFTEQHHFKD